MGGRWQRQAKAQDKRDNQAERDHAAQGHDRVAPGQGLWCLASGIARETTGATPDRHWHFRPRRYVRNMKIALTIVILAAMLAVVGVLLAGLLGMARGDQSPSRSNKLMQWRIGLQGLALVLIALLMWIWRA